jgi:hypothetical protein
MEKTNLTNSRFDDWSEVVDCNTCSRYYDNSCDGVDKGKTRLCTSYLATRDVIIPYEINRLKRQVNGLVAVSMLLTVGIFILAVITI